MGLPIKIKTTFMLLVNLLMIRVDSELVVTGAIATIYWSPHKNSMVAGYISFAEAPTPHERFDSFGLSRDEILLHCTSAKALISHIWTPHEMGWKVMNATIVGASLVE